MSFLKASLRADRLRKLSVKGAVLLVVLVVAGVWFGIYNSNRHKAAERLITGLRETSPGGVNAYLDQLQDYKGLAIRKLEEEYSARKITESETEPAAAKRKLHAAFALLELDESELGKSGIEVRQYLLDSIPAMSKDEGPNLIRALSTIQSQDRQRTQLLKNKPALERRYKTVPVPQLLSQRLEAAASSAEKHRYLAIMLGLEMTDEAVAACRLGVNPEPRTAFIRHFKEFPGDLDRVASILQDPKTDPDLRSALCLAVGTLGAEVPQSIAKVLKKLYDEPPAPGTHSAARWALMQQKIDPQTLVQLPADFPESQEREWYVNEAGMTMLKIPERARLFQMGSPETNSLADSDEHQPHKVELSEFWLCDREVTRKLFERFRDDTNFKERPIGWGLSEEGGRVSPSPEHPVQEVTWHEAAAFCNWLSGECGIPSDEWCYDVKVVEQELMATTHDDWLRRCGYRLPTEAEWECACRSGATTDYSYGDNGEILSDYAWFGGNSGSRAHPVGEKQPNLLGLYDMHGNVWEWCLDDRRDYPTEAADLPLDNPTGSLDSSDRVLRGGGWYDWAEGGRSAVRNGFSPVNRIDYLGFRVARSRSGKSSGAGSEGRGPERAEPPAVEP